MKGNAENATDALIGNRIRIARKQAGLSIIDLAGKLGVSYQQVQKYEMATNRVAASTLSQIAQTLDCPISFFFGMDGESPAASGQWWSLRSAHQMSRIGNRKTRAALAHLIAELA
ncbi:MAG: helix-turn-helix transcriptional regulator [Verrucomicrobiae bacterium]|nr:helix-turn-helix transcriptional regulator [Verrucomicrobiae bacterium]